MMRTLLFWLATGVVFAVPNFMIWKKEQLREHGMTVYFRLAPVDPRSLIQGDYMVLDYEIARNIESMALQAGPQGIQHRGRATVPYNLHKHTDGLAVITLDQKKVVQFRRLHRKEQPLQAGEYLLHYRYRNRRYRVGTNAFFFQEGHASVYERARYGKYKLDTSGKTLLLTLCDDSLNELKPKPKRKRSQIGRNQG